MVRSALWFIVAILVLVFMASRPGPRVHPPGIVAPGDPVQVKMRGAPAVKWKNYQVQPLASFDAEALVLSTRRYRIGREADVSPVDFALGWGPMSSQSVLSKLKISQANRFYFWRSSQMPIPKREISLHSANMHMVPGSKMVREQLLDVVRGDIVHVEGFLVKVQASDGWHWKSSMTRKDTGSGACELVFVRSISVR